MDWIKRNWLRMLLICFVGAAIFFGIIRFWPGVIFGVFGAIAFARAFGQKKEHKEGGEK